MQPLQKIIDTEHIAVQDCALILLCRRFRPDIREMTVHIHLDIISLRVIEHFRNLCKNTVHHFFSGIVEHKLIACTHRFSSRNGKCPVRVFPIEVTVLTDHFRLDPDPKFHAKPTNFFCNFPKRHPKFFLIDRPVAQSCQIIITFSKPPIIEHQHLHAKLRRLFCDLYDFFSGKIKISCLPVIDQNRSFGIAVCTAADVAADQTMQIPRKC